MADRLKTRIEFRLTTDKGNESYPVWSPDGKQIAFGSNNNSKSFDIYVKAAGVTGKETLLLKDDHHKAPLDWSRDGRYLLFSSFIERNASHLWYLPMDTPSHTPVQYLSSSFNESGGHFSPNGQWVAYTSNVSGRPEIYVSPFPDGASAPAVLVSTGGGSMPRWRSDGKAIMYIAADNKLMEVEVTPGSPFKAGVPKALFDPGFGARGDDNGFPWDVSPDGQRFLINQPTEQQAAVPPLTVLLNWQATLKK